MTITLAVQLLAVAAFAKCSCKHDTWLIATRKKDSVECVSALHHNKRKTNYHIHLIFSERELLPEPIEKIATRNMFYNEQKKHVRTKKEILDDSGNVRKGCKIIKKGEVYERTLFTPKNKLFKQEHYLDEAKRFYTDLINLLIEDDKDKLHVFDKNGLYLAIKKIKVPIRITPDRDFSNQ